LREFTLTDLSFSSKGSDAGTFFQHSLSQAYFLDVSITSFGEIHKSNRSTFAIVAHVVGP
jgi:hypothetical protein